MSSGENDRDGWHLYVPTPEERRGIDSERRDDDERERPASENWRARVSAWRRDDPHGWWRR